MRIDIDERTTIYSGDSLEIVPTIAEQIDAVVTDPPYGCGNNNDYTRFRNPNPDRVVWASKNYEAGIPNDDKPFDPSPWLNYRNVVLFGYQFFAQRLPQGTILVWDKKRPAMKGKWLSDAELAWEHRKGKSNKGCYVFNHIWSGFDKQSERGTKSLHPSQKPVALFEWVLGRLKLPAGSLVLDPYMGVGSCGIACQKLGLRYVGIELVPEYFDHARRRLEGLREP